MYSLKKEHIKKKHSILLILLVCIFAPFIFSSIKWFHFHRQSTMHLLAVPYIPRAVRVQGDRYSGIVCSRVWGCSLFRRERLTRGWARQPAPRRHHRSDIHTIVIKKRWGKKSTDLKNQSNLVCRKMWQDLKIVLLLKVKRYFLLSKLCMLKRSIF